MPTPTEIARAKRRQGNMALDTWQDDQRPALERMLNAALDYASAASEYRDTLLWADDVKKHDISVEDTLGGMLDHLSNAVGAIAKKLDDLGVAPERAELDLTELEEAHATAKERADARRVPLVVKAY